ncbi:flagellar basal-body rod modification protein FlgD [Sporomusaceae bacterium BoRhaA]|uniref:flagellar hook assembly protein FlgD n=1 Tax=Pelorhabdus rhamnosifermentans TaxID=2772457 RepID=UPI001C060C05|nr:flagellar hook capping FlgD N-terminal domain-containing protein [Pelorhabdus rhamnosifermentans]MBU2703566.1 flagellar basal-body rod modification protein FlgD [Pelorhabdus rhamnosifermentans]
MSTAPVSGSSDWWKTPTDTDPKKDTKGTNNLSDFNTFMKILASELQNQDPTNPVSNTEYVAQLAQVESLSQLQGMKNMLTTNSAYNLIGTSVTYQTTDSATGAATTDTGTAKAVVVKNDEPYLVVNGGLVKVSDVIIVAPAASK